MHRITNAGLDPIYPDVFDRSFAEWIDGDGLRRWTSEYGGPFTVTRPEDLARQVEERAARARESGQASEPSIMTMKF
jgi:hypothetical protein